MSLGVEVAVRRVLLELADLGSDEVVPAGGWRRRAADQLVGTLDSRTDLYPCVFGVDALRKGGLRFAFIEDADSEEGARTLAAALREFLAVFPTLPRRSSLITWLDVQPGQDVDGYRAVFWRALSRLRALDDRPWPADIAADPEDPWWEFCFGGEPLFVVCATAAHTERRSRSAENMMITFQPRPVFDGLDSDTPAGQRARKIIRGRLATYDSVPAHPALGPYGDPDHREWRQYFLPDTDTAAAADSDTDTVPARCPLTGATAGGTR